MAEKKVYWHLPGFCYFRNLNMITIELMNKYPECFNDGYCVGSVYGTFPGAVWNGGRAVLGLTLKNDIEKILKAYNALNIPVRFTWTNSLLEEKHVYDTYCNLIMRLADNGMNQVLVNTPVLENYLRENYPNFKYISSTTKRLKTLEEIRAELDKDYFMVVLDYDLNHNEEVLKSLEPCAERVEILVDEVCFPGCPRRKDHYADESRKQLEFEAAAPFECQNKYKPSFEECKKRPQFISDEQMKDYIDRGFVNFKIVGRGLPAQMVEESYLYYLVKPEKREFIKSEMHKLAAAIAKARAAK